MAALSGSGSPRIRGSRSRCRRRRETASSCASQYDAVSRAFPARPRGGAGRTPRALSGRICSRKQTRSVIARSPNNLRSRRPPGRNEGGCLVPARGRLPTSQERGRGALLEVELVDVGLVEHRRRPEDNRRSCGAGAWEDLVGAEHAGLEGLPGLTGDQTRMPAKRLRIRPGSPGSAGSTARTPCRSRPTRTCASATEAEAGEREVLQQGLVGVKYWAAVEIPTVVGEMMPRRLG